MGRRFVIVAGVVLVATLALISVSTARARQLSKESAAGAKLTLARNSAWGRLGTALSDGVPAGSLAVVRRQMTSLGAVRPPSSIPVLGTTREHFFLRQARKYSGMSQRVQAIEEQTVKSRRRALNGTIAELRRVIETAKAVDLPLAAEVDALQRSESDATSSRTPRALDQDTVYVERSVQSATTEVAAQRAAIAKEQAKAASAGGMSALASSEAESLSTDLDQLELFSSSAAKYRDQLSQDVGEIQSSKGGVKLALLGMHMDGDVAAARQAYERTVPSKYVLVSTERQSAELFQDGREIFSTPVTTGGPELPTDHGVFHIYDKLSAFTFHSPWPVTSPYYYSPSFVQYWMPFDGGEGLHDASWRSNFGPGSNVQPTDLGGGRSILGTHGCVNLPTDAAAYIWNWAPVGTAVVVV